MSSSIVVEGRLVSPTQIELSEPIEVADSAVEVEVRPRREQRRQMMLDYLCRLKALPGRGRSAEDIMRQIEEERDSWETGR
jgi:hypothetical protein